MGQQDSTRAETMEVGRGVSRRLVVTSAAWSVPVITIAAAAPAYAASTDPWVITSASFEGTSAGARNNSGTIQFQFTLTIPDGATVTAPQCVMNFNPAGNGVTITGISGTGTGTVDGWAYQGTNGDGASANSYRTFIFTRTDLTGPATVTLNFQMNSIAGSDIAADTAATFLSSNATTGPNVVFQVLAANIDPSGSATEGFITSPHV